MNAKYACLSDQCKTCVELKSYPKMDGQYKTWDYGCTHPLWDNEICTYHKTGQNPLTYYENTVE